MNRLLPLTAIALLLLASAARGGEQEAEQEAVEQAAAEVADLQTRLDAARAALEQTNTEVDRAQFEAAKRAFEEARRRLEAVDALRTRIESIERDLETMRASGLADDVTAKQHLAELERLKSALSDARAKPGGPEDAKVWLRAALRARLQSEITEKEAQLAALGTEITDQHPEQRRLRREIETAKRHLAALGTGEATVQPGRPLRLVPGEDGSFRFVGEEEGDGHVFVFVDGRLEVRGSIVAGDGEVVSGPVRVEKIEHLREAAMHLRQAGRTEEAERLEGEARALEASLTRYTVTVTGDASSARVLQAIGDLRQEVRALRKEVKELKALILEAR